MDYSETLLDHFNNPRNMGSMDKDDPDVGTGVVGSPECGDVMKLQIRIGPDGRIVDAKFKTFGCGAAIASSSLATEWLKGRTLAEAAELQNTDLAEELQLPPVKLHCSVLAESAVKAAIADLRSKQAGEGGDAGDVPCEVCPAKASCSVAEDTLVPAAPLGELREEAAVVLSSADGALAREAVTTSQRRMIEMAATMLHANIGRDDPEQIRLAMDMVREAVAAVSD